MAPPIHLRRLKADMVLKDLDLRTVSRGTGIAYTYASEILNGTRIHPDSLNKLKAYIERAPMPKEAVR